MDALSTVGYKLRKSIWEHLKSRSQAIQTAIDKYNALADQMAPRAPQILWKDAIDTAFIADFDILRNRYSVRSTAPPNELWMQPGNREVMNKYFKILRAREELERCNVEIARLRAWIYHEEDQYLTALEKAAEKDLHAVFIGLELGTDFAARTRTNRHHHQILNRIEALAEFSGVRGAGRPPDRIVTDEDEIDKSLGDDEDGLGGATDDEEWEDCLEVTEVLERHMD